MACVGNLQQGDKGQRKHHTRHRNVVEIYAKISTEEKNWRRRCTRTGPELHPKEEEVNTGI